MSKEPNMKYFIYSKEEVKQRSEIEAKLGKKFFPGSIIINGRPKQFTQKVSNVESLDRYSDYRIVAYQDVNTAKFTDPYSL